LAIHCVRRGCAREGRRDFRQDLPAEERHRDTDQVEAEKKRFLHAPLVIAVVSKTSKHPKVPPWEQELSAGASAMNIVHAAHALGYVANWLTGWMAFDRDVLTALGLSDDEKIAGFIHIGHAARPADDRPRPALGEIVTRF
jgi:nitroreductase